MSAVKTMLTVGVIAERLVEPIHRIEYALKSRNIKASGVAGRLRIYEEEDLERIAEALREIDESRPVKN